MEADKVVENILVGLPTAVGKLRNSWKDVLNVHIKAADSAALPVYSSVPNDAAIQAVNPNFGKKVKPAIEEAPVKTEPNVDQPATPSSQKKSSIVLKNVLIFDFF